MVFSSGSARRTPPAEPLNKWDNCEMGTCPGGAGANDGGGQ